MCTDRAMTLLCDLFLGLTCQHVSPEPKNVCAGDLELNTENVIQLPDGDGDQMANAVECNCQEQVNGENWIEIFCICSNNCLSGS